MLPNCWTIDHHSVAFTPSPSLTIDLDQFAELQARERWREAADLLGGEFLEGLALDDNPEFENWVLGERERWRACAETVLRRVIEAHARRGQYTDALRHAQRLLQMAPWDEGTHRGVMRFLAWTGRRGAALRQFELCQTALREELAVEPAAETVALFERIQAGELDLPPQLPAFLSDEKPRHAHQRPLFVGRETELAQLDAFLNGARAGDGRVVFITGGPGQGKTALLEAFARQSMERHPDLLVASGRCSAYAGVGDPYLPYRDLMAMLTGEVEGLWDAGAITPDHAQRLWAASSLVVETLLDHGAYLLDILVSSRDLLARGTAVGGEHAPWLPRLREALSRDLTASRELGQSELYQQVARVLSAVARTRPLLLILDDIQWADAASVSLLFHLGRRLAEAEGEILIACAYRPEEVAAGRDGERHPLAKALGEFKRSYGDVWVDLDRVDTAEEASFVDAILDAETNRLGGPFRVALLERTRGHPLFTIELLRAMQDRGELRRDADGAWIEGQTLDWEQLPARVEAVIQERIDQLDPELQELLNIACVEGELFTGEVLARVRGEPKRWTLRQLSGELVRRHRLVREGQELQTSMRRMSRYRFAHSLFQLYLYNHLGPGERRLLHREIGEALEALYGDETDAIAPQLARHFRQGEATEKAIHYLLQSGDRARSVHAYQEAIDAYRPAIGLLKEQGDDRAGRTLMKLGLTYHSAMAFGRAREAYAEAFALWRGTPEGQPARSMAPAPHSLRLSWNTRITLDPTHTKTADDLDIVKQLLSGLVQASSDLGVVPDVAESWEMLDGGRRYIFSLREEARWSDGTPVTAGDFAYAWFAPSTGQPTRPTRASFSTSGAPRRTITAKGAARRWGCGPSTSSPWRWSWSDQRGISCTCSPEPSAFRCPDTSWSYTGSDGLRRAPWSPTALSCSRAGRRESGWF